MSITLGQTTGISQLSDIVASASEIASIISTAVTIGINIEQIRCTGQTLRNLWDQRKSHKSREYLSVYPALAYPTRTSSPITDINNIIRHGILIKTAYNGKNVFFYIGGFTSEWKDKGVSRLAVSQGGVTFRFNGNKDIVSSLAVKLPPIAIIPVRGSTKTEFVNPPSTPQCGDLLQILQNLAYADFAVVPNYFPLIYQLVVTKFGSLTFDFYYNTPDRHWIPDYELVKLIDDVTSGFPTFNASLIILPQIANIQILGVYPNPRVALFPIVYSFTKLGSETLIFPFPILNGSPVISDMVCSGCGNLSLMGFITDYNGTGFNLDNLVWAYSASLYLPPTDFTFDAIKKFALQLISEDLFNEMINRVLKADDVVNYLVSVFGMPLTEANEIVNSITWFGYEFEKSVEEIARDIYNEINSQSHDRSSHTDNAGQEIHDAYMCARFGICY